MKISELREIAEARVAQSALAAWLSSHLLLDSALRKWLLRLGIRASELAAFLCGDQALPASVLALIARDTGIEQTQLGFQFAVAAQAGEGRPAKLRDGDIYQTPDFAVAVRLTLYKGAGHFLQEGDASHKGINLRATPNNRTTTGDYIIPGAPLASVSISTGIAISSAEEIVEQFHINYSVLPEIDFLTRVRRHKSIIMVEIIRVRESRTPKHIRPGMKLGFLQFGAAAVVGVHITRGEGAPNPTIATPRRPKRKETAALEGGGLSCDMHGSGTTCSFCAAPRS